MKVFYLGSNENKNSGKDLQKVEARLAEENRKWIVLKLSHKNVKMLNKNLIISNKYRWSIGK